MKRQSIYKYLSEERWANAFMNGSVLFRSLAYYRDYEDGNVRGDYREGSSVFRPAGGLVGYNETTKQPFALPNHGFISNVNPAEIFVLCTSRTLGDDLRREFDASVCVEITNVPEFCDRVARALPTGASFPGRLGRTRLGNRVEYYDEREQPGTRWALPDAIGLAKGNVYARQDEFRLLFSLTDALDFEKMSLRLEPNPASHVPDPTQHHDYIVQAPSLRDICILHRF